MMTSEAESIAIKYYFCTDILWVHHCLEVGTNWNKIIWFNKTTTTLKFGSMLKVLNVDLWPYFGSITTRIPEHLLPFPLLNRGMYIVKYQIMKNLNFGFLLYILMNPCSSWGRCNTHKTKKHIILGFHLISHIPCVQAPLTNQWATAIINS